MDDTNYPLAKHADTGLVEFESGQLPSAYHEVMQENGIDPLNAYSGEKGLDNVDFITQQWLQGKGSNTLRDEFYPGGLDDFILVANLIVLEELDRIDRNPFLVKNRLLVPNIRFLMYMFLKDMENVDDRIFDLAHESEMVIMDNTILDHYHFSRSKNEAYGHFTLKRGNAKFPVSLEFHFVGNPSKTSFEYSVKPQTTN